MYIYILQGYFYTYGNKKKESEVVNMNIALHFHHEIHNKLPKHFFYKKMFNNTILLVTMVLI